MARVYARMETSGVSQQCLCAILLMQEARLLGKKSRWMTRVATDGINNFAKHNYCTVMSS